jgi:hypothetical protein
MVKTIKDIFLEASSLNDYLSSRGINPKFVSRDTKISHAKSALFQKWKSDRKMSEETITESSESELLAKYLNSRGINAKYATRDMKIAHSKSGEFMKWKRDHQHLELAEETDSIDTITVDIPLMIRLLELAREDVKDDMELHKITERLIEIRSKGTLSMEDYDFIANGKAKIKEEVELNEDNLDSIAKKHGMEFNRTTYGAGMKHKTKGEVSINRYGEWNHYPAGSRHSKAHGDSSFNFKDLDKHLSTLKEEVLDEAKMPRTTALDRWRKAATEREIKHNDIEKKRQEKLHQDPSKVTVPVADTKKDDLSKSINDLERHLNKEEVEQIDELKKSTMASYKDKSSASLKNAQANRDAAEPGKDMSKAFADLHAKSNKIAKNRVKGLIGYMQRKQGMKPTSENTLDSMAATEAPSDCSDNTNSTPTTGKSYGAKMVKALKKTVKEETYDWEKDDKSSMEKPYGKAPKINVTDKTGTLGDTKPEARVVMKGGKTLTGQPRDMVEIDPSMKQRPGQQDKGQSTFTSPIAKKSP